MSSCSGPLTGLACARVCSGVVVGPRGPSPPTQEPVVQLTYVYGCKKRKAVDGGLRALVLAAGEGEAAAELADPDSYPLLLE